MISVESEAAKSDAARRKLADCEQRLARYRNALDTGADPAVVSTWIAEVQGEKLAAQQVLARAPRQAWNATEIRALLDDLGDVREVLERADGEAKAEVYASLGLNLTYRPDQQLVEVVATPVGGGLKNVSEERRALSLHQYCGEPSALPDNRDLASQNRGSADPE